MQPTLPIEIVEWILDLVLEEAAADEWRQILMECVLVCRAWTPYCQSHLFREQKLAAVRRIPERVYNLRRRYKAAPHLCNYIRRFRIYVPIVADQVYPIFFAVLAPLLPSLRHVQLVLAEMPILHHRIFRAPSYKASSITSIQFDYWNLLDYLNLYELISAFPNLRKLTLDGIAWSDSTSHTKGLTLASVSSMRPRMMSSLPPIAQLAVATEIMTTVQTAPLESSRLQLEGLSTLMNSFASTLIHLKINLGTFNYFTHPYLHPDRQCATVWDLPRLESFEIHLRGPRVKPLNEPYTARIARIPKLLWAMRAGMLRVVDVYLSHFELEELQFEVVEPLAALNQELDEIVEVSHFPRLDKIRFDVNCSWSGQTWWNKCFAEIYPRLWKAGIIENLVIAYEHYERSNFVDIRFSEELLQANDDFMGFMAAQRRAAEEKWRCD